MSILVFDIETIPDLQAAKKLYNLPELSEEDTANALFALRRAKVGHEFLPHHLQRVVAISLLLEHDDQIRLWSLGDDNADEKELITRFFSGIEHYTPTLVSWNGSGFDLPVLHYRALLHGVSAPTYWEYGEQQQAFRWNNYLNRFHYRHLDVMDILSGYQNKAFAPLDEIAHMLGFPGKMGMDGSRVFAAYQEGKYKEIADYCETDVLNTYGVYLRFELMRGTLTQKSYTEKIKHLRDYLAEAGKQRPHLQAFLASCEECAGV